MTENKEIERKFLIKYPGKAFLDTIPDRDKSEITQTYLVSEKGVTARVRKRVYEDGVKYTKTEKVRINAVSCFEDEHEITEAEYEAELAFADKKKNAIVKTRVMLRSENHVFEIDLYPFWMKQAVMEVELESEDESFTVPENIEIIREVTSDRRYKNASLAHSIPKE